MSNSQVQITSDDIYDTVAPGDLAALMHVDRYGRRTSAFDKIISATHDHFWDPLESRASSASTRDGTRSHGLRHRERARPSQPGEKPT